MTWLLEALARSAGLPFLLVAATAPRCRSGSPRSAPAARRIPTFCMRRATREPRGAARVSCSRRARVDARRAEPSMVSRLRVVLAVVRSGCAYFGARSRRHPLRQRVLQRKTPSAPSVGLRCRSPSASRFGAWSWRHTYITTDLLRRCRFSGSCRSRSIYSRSCWRSRAAGRCALCSRAAPCASSHCRCWSRCSPTPRPRGGAVAPSPARPLPRRRVLSCRARRRPSFCRAPHGILSLALVRRRARRVL